MSEWRIWKQVPTRLTVTFAFILQRPMHFIVIPSTNGRRPSPSAPLSNFPSNTTAEQEQQYIAHCTDWEMHWTRTNDRLICNLNRGSLLPGEGRVSNACGMPGGGGLQTDQYINTEQHDRAEQELKAFKNLLKCHASGSQVVSYWDDLDWFYRFNFTALPDNENDCLLACASRTQVL